MSSKLEGDTIGEGMLAVNVAGMCCTNSADTETISLRTVETAVSSSEEGTVCADRTRPALCSTETRKVLPGAGSCMGVDQLRTA